MPTPLILGFTVNAIRGLTGALTGRCSDEREVPIPVVQEVDVSFLVVSR